MTPLRPKHPARRLSRGWKEEYAAPVTTEKHNTLGMAYSWGRLAARLGWNLDEDLHNEVDPAFHQVACTAYQSVKGASLIGKGIQLEATDKHSSMPEAFDEKPYSPLVVPLVAFL